MRSRKSVPLSAAKRSASAEANTSMPKACGAMPARSGIKATEATEVGSANHCTASKPTLVPQYGRLSEWAKVVAVSLTPWA